MKLSNVLPIVIRSMDLSEIGSNQPFQRALTQYYNDKLNQYVFDSDNFLGFQFVNVLSVNNNLFMYILT